MNAVLRAFDFIIGLILAAVSVWMGWVGIVALQPLPLIFGIVLFSLSAVLTAVSLADMVHSRDVQAVRRTGHSGGVVCGTRPGGAGIRASEDDRDGGSAEGTEDVPRDPMHGGGAPEGEHVRGPLGEDAAGEGVRQVRTPAPRLAGVGGPRLTTRYSDAPEHDPENPSQECLTHILTEGAIFMSELFSHGGKILRAVYPDTITIQIGEHVVEMRANTETQNINLKAVR